MQLWTQSEYFFVASAVPSPWSHLAAHSVVSTAWEELGRAMPKHEAWQVTSAGLQAWTQLMDGETPGTAVVAGALVTEDCARAPTAKARRAAVYFIVEIGSCDTMEVV